MLCFYSNKRIYDWRLLMKSARPCSYFLHILLLIIIIILMSKSVNGQNWPQWRGPDANSIADQGDYPVEFSATDDILWLAPLPGKGSSTPIVWEDHIFLTSGIGEGEEGEDGVLCFDWMGKQLWQAKLGKQQPGRHPRGSGSNPSIVTDGARLFAYYKSGTLVALDFEGNVLWKTNLRQKYGDIIHNWDLGTSPVLAGDNVVIAVMHEGSSYLVAFDQKSGNVAWKTDRNYSCEFESGQSYTTPTVIKEGNRTMLVVWGADHLTGHDTATGKLIWECGGFNPDQKSMWRVIASPAISQGIAIVPYGRDKFLAGVKIGGSGDITATARIWEKKGIGTDVATPVAKDGKVYVVSFNGKMWCLDIQTGEELWQTKLPRAGGMFYSSPVLSGNKLYLCREEGKVYVCEISHDGMQVVNETEFDDYFVATPVLVRDKILLRGEKNLYCIGK
jgi:outer membrane protein assembly factor BamB